MSATVRNNSPKREGSFSIRSSDGIPVLDESYSYIVECTSRNEPYASVISATSLPRYGATSPSGLGICKGIKGTRREQNTYFWDVICDFSSEVNQKTIATDPTTDPVTWVPIYETKSRQISEVVINDLAGKAIANSAGQPFQVGLTLNRKIPVWEFYQIEPPLDDEIILDRNETVNIVPFKNKPAKSLLLEVISSTVGFYYGAKRRLTHYSISYNKKLWTHKRLDVGTYYFDGTFDSDGPVKKPYLDSQNKVINGGLNGAGGKASPSGTPPSILNFEQYTQVAFATFLRI